MHSVAVQVNALGPFDAIIHNAGIGYRERRRIATVDGLPQLFAVNTLAPYVLTALIQRNGAQAYSDSRPRHRRRSGWRSATIPQLWSPANTSTISSCASRYRRRATQAFRFDCSVLVPRSRADGVCDRRALQRLGFTREDSTMSTASRLCAGTRPCPSSARAQTPCRCRGIPRDHRYCESPRPGSARRGASCFEDNARREFPP
jgi:NAD(P)-dependent dehydrogenase (short-subunit alcohol dehydrogenase family)